MIEYLGKSWQFARRNWRNFFPLTILYVLCLALPELLKYLLPEGYSNFALAIAGLSALLIILLDFLFVDYVFRIDRGQTPRVARLFYFAKFLLPSILIGSVFGILIFFLSLACLRFASFLLPVPLGLVFFVGVRTIFWRFVLIDQGLSVWRSIRGSWALTKGSFWPLAIMAIVVILVDSLGIAIVPLAVLALPLSTKYMWHLCRSLVAKP